MKVKITTVLFRSPHLLFNRTTYLDKKDREREWYWAERPHGAKAVVVVATVDGKLVVTEEFRVPVMGIVWDLPAGLIDPNESPRDAAVRELKEETGYDVDHVDWETPFVFSSPGMTDEACCLVYVQASGSPSTAGTESSEEIKVHLMAPKEISDLLSNTSINIGAKAYLVFDRFRRHGTV